MKRFAFICVYSRLLLAADDPAVQMERELKKLVGVYAAVERESADPVPAVTAIYQGAIPGMLRRPSTAPSTVTAGVSTASP